MIVTIFACEPFPGYRLSYNPPDMSLLDRFECVRCIIVHTTKKNSLRFKLPTADKHYGI